MVSDEKSVVNLIEDLLFVVSCFSCLPLLRFCLAFNSLIMMRLGVALSEYGRWSLLNFFGVWVVFHQIGSFQPLFLQIFFLSFSLLFSFWDCHDTYAQALFIFLCSFFFLLLSLDNLNWPIFGFANSFFYPFKL